MVNCLILALVGGVTGGVLLQSGFGGLCAAVAAFAAPYLRLSIQRRGRLEKLEEQMPDAIDVIKRALRAGHPFNAAIKLVADDMDQPIAKEFELTFSDLNYGGDVRRALLALFAPVPSLTVIALSTSVMVQRQTGGNLAAILDHLAKVVRGRFRF